MAKIQIPKIIKPLQLADYEPAYGDAVVMVHVNPPSGELAELRARMVETAMLKKRAEGEPTPDELIEIARKLDELGGFMFEWYAANWSRADDPETHWTADELRELYAGTKDVDPALWPWLTGKTVEMIADYRSGQKKA